MQCAYTSWVPISYPPKLKLSSSRSTFSISQTQTHFEKRPGDDSTDVELPLPSHVKSITSTSNPFVKHCLKLRHSSSYRHSHGSVLVVGATPIREIYRFQEPLHGKALGMDCLLLLDKAEVPEGIDDLSVRIVRVSSVVMKKLSGVQSIESIEAIALMRIPTSFFNLDGDQEKADCQRWFPSPHRILVLDGIQLILTTYPEWILQLKSGTLWTICFTNSVLLFTAGPGKPWMPNIGAVVQQGGAFLLPGCCDPFNEKALRASRGASFQLPIVSGSWVHLEALINEFQMKALAGHPESTGASKTVSQLSQGLADSLVDFPLCLVLGSEGSGLSEKSRQECELVSILMAGEFESLNVSVAGGIFMYMLSAQELVIWWGLGASLDSLLKAKADPAFNTSEPPTPPPSTRTASCLPRRDLKGLSYGSIPLMDHYCFKSFHDLSPADPPTVSSLLGFISVSELLFLDLIGHCLAQLRRQAMSAGKPHQPASSSSHFSWPMWSLQSSLLTLAIVTLFSFTYFSLNSLHSPLSSSPTPQVSVAKPLVRNEKACQQAVSDGVDEEFSDIYHSPSVFRLNYAEMERRFKVYIYPDGDPNTFYQTPRKLTGKYASEGYFFQNIRESRFRTDDPNRAHLFFIPISCHKMRGKGTSYENMTIIVHNYVQSLISKYPYWNRTLGADHFFVTCHDVGVRATEGVELLVKNSIRVVCSPSYDVGFIPHKDVALPQVLQPFALPAGGNDLENRTTLGFWAGHRNSKIRVILARVWENDTELDISNNRINRAMGPLLYQKRFYRTKFCICPGGSQVNSARITDSIHYGCVPVILSNYYDLPFNDILDWHKFAVVLKENDVYQLKQILKDIPDAEFVALHKNLVKVQRHYQWNSPPIKYDAFHMVMYELWLRHHGIKY
ncbi:hypothetical protein FH972_006863 [Carpinus fangiana]|uniref:Exostosin GT47 domain-containing protein n=1 Tax=Carpinus fangiana TaxID=176857 RepID=A0A5N6QTJ3_9ROSI|nr:hypothetical protein FH972_006863 [Carpinus fangiana]